MYRLFVFFIAIYLHGPAFAQLRLATNSCVEFQQFGQDEKLDLSPIDLITHSLSLNQLIILGERHDTHASFSRKQIIEDAQSAGQSVDCFFIELPQDTTEEEVELTIHGVSNRMFDTENLLTKYGTLLKFFKQSHIKYFFVDILLKDYSSELRSTDFMGWMSERDRMMISNINKQFQNGSCRNGIFVVGSRHIQPISDQGINLYPSMAKMRDLIVPATTIIHEVNTDNLPPDCSIMASSVYNSEGLAIRDMFNLDHPIFGSGADYLVKWLFKE